MHKVIFEIKEEHIKLMNRMNVDWSDIEFGAPMINPYRPYGNSDLYSDIAEILGIPFDWNKEEELTDDLFHQLGKWHYEMKYVLRIFLKTGKVQTGTYIADWIKEDWKEATNQEEMKKATSLSKEIEEVLNKGRRARIKILNDLDTYGLKGKILKTLTNDELYGIRGRYLNRLKEEENKKYDEIIDALLKKEN